MFQIRLIYNKENPISSGFWTLEECIFNSGYWVRRYWFDGKELRTGDFDEWNVATGTEYDNSTNHYVYQNDTGCEVNWDHWSLPPRRYDQN
jgi:hypothetical protein